MNKTNLTAHSTVSFQDLERALDMTITVPPDKAFYPPLFHPFALSVWTEVLDSELYSRYLNSKPTPNIPQMWSWVVLEFELRCRERGKPTFIHPTDRTALHELYVELSDLRRRAVKFLNEYRLFDMWEVRLDKKIQMAFNTDTRGMSIETTAFLKPIREPTVAMKKLVAVHPGPTFHGHNRGGILHRKLPEHRRGSTVSFVADFSSPSVNPMFKMIVRTPRRPYLTVNNTILSEKQINDIAYRQVWLPLVRLHRVDAIHISRLF